MVLRDEPLVREMLAKLPAQDRDSFTDEQIRALLASLDGKAAGNQGADLTSNPRFWRTYNDIVMLGGGAGNACGKGGSALSNLTRLVAIAGLFGTLFLFFGLALYVIKSALGIDFLPGFSFGIWDWFKEVVLQQG